MKKKLLFVATMFIFNLCFSETSFAQIVTIPDANFKAALVANPAINTNGDGEIQVSEAEVYDGYIDVYNMGISDLTGIEAFTSLTGLFCHYNSVSSLDLSQNIKLKNLGCVGNSMSSLNISQNVDLVSINCQNNSLINLDLSHNLNLFYLVCYNNMLSSLDVSHNTALYRLVCDNNGIGSLDLSHNTALGELECGNTSISSLDLSNNIVLAYLYCGYNSLSSIDVSHNPLEVLVCDGNSISSLDLSNNTALTYLNCNNNPLISLDVSHNGALTVLLCENDGLTSLNIANGNNLNVTDFYALNNPDLSCIQVDDIAWSAANWTLPEHVDATAHFSTNCSCSLSVSLTATSATCANSNNGSITSAVSNGTGNYTYSWENGSTDADRTNLTAGAYWVLVTDDAGCTRTASAIVGGNTPIVLSLTPTAATSCLVNDGSILLNVSGGSSTNGYSFIITDAYGSEIYNNVAYDGNTIYGLFPGIYHVTATDLNGCSASADTTVGGGMTVALIPTATSCAGNDGTISTTVSGGSGVYTYSWDYFGATEPNLGSLMPGVYTISVSDDAGCTQLASTTVTPSIAIVNIPDANFKGALLADPSINTNGDGEIQVCEAEAFAGQMYVGSSNIADLTGIEAFTSLNALSCSNNSLSSLDVSHNINLLYLDCSGNSLISLDLSHNIYLSTLNCSYNSLISLDVSQNINLVYLYCYYNSLSNLDLSHNINLANLYCSDNSLSSLDVSQNINLFNVDCSTNYLSSLDVSQNIILWYLTCSHNSLSSLDVSQNINLSILYCYYNYLGSLDMSNNINLRTLGCGFNSLSSLDVIHNIDLQFLNCGYNLLSSLDVSHNINLLGLDCSHNTLSSLSVNNNINLLNLSCGYNSLSSLNVSQNINIDYLECSHNTLNNLDLSHNVNLSILYCYLNSLGSLDVSHNINVANGHNTNIYGFWAYGNPSLSCVQVDDVAWSTTHWTGHIDNTAAFSLNCQGTTVSKTLNLTVFPEGLYNTETGLLTKTQGTDDGSITYDMFTGTIADTLSIALAETTAPFNTVFEAHGIFINTDGKVELSTIPGSLTGNYYIIIRHRNHVETWSQYVSFAGQTIGYNFTDDVAKAWGNNLKQVGSVYCIYTGDANGDQYIDGFDLAVVFNQNLDGAFGYQLEDLNGDGFVDGFDMALVFNNNLLGAGMNTPIAPMGPIRPKRK